MVITLFIILCLQFYLYVRVDRAIYGTYYTPAIILTFPYLLVLGSHILLHQALYFKQISAFSVLFWNVGTLVFWFIGVLNAKFFLKRVIKQPFSGIRGYDISIKGLHSIVLIITFFNIFLMLCSLVLNIEKYGIENITSEEFANEFAGGGVFGYSLITLRFLLIYLIVKVKKGQVFSILAIVIIIIFNILYQVKGWLLLPVLAGIIVRFGMLNDKKGVSKKLLKKIIIVVVFGFAIFSLFYYFSLGSKVSFQFILEHFFHYLWSGIIGLSELLKSDIVYGGNTNILFNPINNFYNKIVGLPLDSVVDETFFNSYLLYYKGTNVSTFFGTIFTSSGLFNMFWIICVFSTASYGSFFVFLIRRNIFNLVLYSFIMSGLFFGWFNFYFQHIIFYFFIFIAIFFNILIVKHSVKK